MNPLPNQVFLNGRRYYWVSHCREDKTVLRIIRQINPKYIGSFARTEQMTITFDQTLGEFSRQQIASLLGKHPFTPHTEVHESVPP